MRAGWAAERALRPPSGLPRGASAGWRAGPSERGGVTRGAPLRSPARGRVRRNSSIWPPQRARGGPAASSRGLPGKGRPTASAKCSMRGLPVRLAASSRGGGEGPLDHTKGPCGDHQPPPLPPWPPRCGRAGFPVSMLANRRGSGAVQGMGAICPQRARPPHRRKLCRLIQAGVRAKKAKSPS